MNILFVQFTHISKSLNGAEQYHHNLAKMLIAKGHAVIPCCHEIQGEVLYDGVLAVEYSRIQHLYEWADLIITTPGKLRNNPLKKPIVFIQHNTNREPWDLSESRVLYCGHHVRDKVNYNCKDSFVYWPPNRYADAEPLPPNPTGRITLVNCNLNKGGRLMAHFARKLANYHFLGIMAGYGQQITCGELNVEYRTGQHDLREVLKDTSIVIMPSEREGLPTLAQECLSLGVPVVGSAIPAFVELGLRKNCKVTANYLVDDIRWTMENYHEARQQALELAAANEAKRDTEGLIKWLTNV